MNHFEYQSETLFVESVPLPEIAREFGTPTFVYSSGQLKQNYHDYCSAFQQRNFGICYAVKANDNIGVLNQLAQLGCGFDIVSAGELERVKKAGGELNKTVFAGVGKTNSEIEAAIAADIACFNVESVDEIDRIDQIAGALGQTARIAVRVNPDVDPKTHPYISTGMNENKFGIPMTEAMDVYALAKKKGNLQITGVACHIGSQLTEIAPFVAAAERLRRLLSDLEAAGHDIDHVDIGGGLGISYGDAEVPTIKEYINALCDVIDDRYRLVVEPGRSMIGNAGVLLTKVLYIKSTPVKTFAIVDASMTELIRPALYQASHRIEPVTINHDATSRRVDIVGPVCETGDFLGKDRDLSIAVDDLLVVRDVGAYGAVMASNYNARPRPCEVLVDNDDAHLIRRRQALSDLFRDELIPDI